MSRELVAWAFVIWLMLVGLTVAIEEGVIQIGFTNFIPKAPDYEPTGVEIKVCGWDQIEQKARCPDD